MIIYITDDTEYKRVEGKSMELIILDEAQKPCDAGCTNGIFYFTGEDKLEDSQPCGNCNGKGWTWSYNEKK